MYASPVELPVLKVGDQVKYLTPRGPNVGMVGIIRKFEDIFACLEVKGRTGLILIPVTMLEKTP